jgi:hypothetical protein
MYGKKRRPQRRSKRGWICEGIEVEIEAEVEADMVGVNGKENLVLYFVCITYNPGSCAQNTILIGYKRNIPVCQVVSFCRYLNN